MYLFIHFTLLYFCLPRQRNLDDLSQRWTVSWLSTGLVGQQLRAARQTVTNGAVSSAAIIRIHTYFCCDPDCTQRPRNVTQLYTHKTICLLYFKK